MGSIIQLQRFEMTVGNFENCQKHTSAAIVLFKQIFRAAENVIDRGELSTFTMSSVIWDGDSGL